MSFYPNLKQGEIPVGSRRHGNYFQLGIWPYYPEIPLFQVLRNSAMLMPESPTMLHPKKMTIKEIDNLSDKLATALTDFGVKKGDTVALYMWNSPEFVLAFFGALKTGAKVTALNPSFKEKDAKHQLEDSESVAVIFEDDLYSVIMGIEDKLPRALQECSVQKRKSTCFGQAMSFAARSTIASTSTDSCAKFIHFGFRADNSIILSAVEFSLVDEYCFESL